MDTHGEYVNGSVALDTGSGYVNVEEKGAVPNNDNATYAEVEQRTSHDFRAHLQDENGYTHLKGVKNRDRGERKVPPNEVTPSKYKKQRLCQLITVIIGGCVIFIVAFIIGYVTGRSEKSQSDTSVLSQDEDKSSEVNATLTTILSTSLRPTGTPGPPTPPTTTRGPPTPPTTTTTKSTTTTTSTTTTPSKTKTTTTTNPDVPVLPPSGPRGHVGAPG